MKGIEETNNAKKIGLYALTWPIFIELLLHMLLGNADTLMLSQYSDNSVAAVGVSNQLIMIVIVIFGFVATGTAIVVSQHIGAKQEAEAKEVTAVAISIILIFGLIISLLLSLSGQTLLKAMGLPSELMQEANLYLKIVGGFAFIQALIMTIGAVLRSHGFTKDSMFITIGMNTINVIGNFLVIFGPFGLPVLGVEGVAWVTTISRIIGLIAIFIILLKRIGGNIPIVRVASVFKVHIRNLLKIGIPSAGEQLSYNLSQIMITTFIATLGTEALTTKVYTQNIMVFILLFSVSIGQGTQILIGRLVGAGEIEKAYRQCLQSLKIAILLSILMGIAFSIVSKSLFNLFTTNPQIIALGSTLILLSIILEPGRSFNLVVISSLRAAGDAKFPVYMGLLSMWGIAVPLAYFLGIVCNLGLIGIWIAYITDEWIRGVIMLLRWRSRKWESKRLISPDLQLQT